MKTSLTISPVFALVSKKRSPASSAYALASSLGTSRSDSCSATAALLSADSDAASSSAASAEGVAAGAETRSSCREERTVVSHRAVEWMLATVCANAEDLGRRSRMKGGLSREESG